ncbi:Peptidoglycan/LPS O-acetylase OafA/YrhL, contains acyltransferase and SGNH-hydrolase domains [Rathayibacter oskolensis]|uniref:Peptidoglycan/LPS O-acetylase OafA/YrhL, contains acyltransferase and SGNH-hydrolase domains n=1 Tax=Rathayibacter oskolensis TaxID=1891671 RepID=A0A1X7NB19_9MICO|nr:Peptidoglycan/LPS O-acetylase OafA/YrhL, contains acyltransferase and SGNH-hydrolase domains [Rathayibacter oskolensis]
MAVLLVVLYHASVPVLGGGYVGVDVFFVISGFLITSHLAQELQAGRLRLRDFYARRIRRIVPAALLVLIVTLVASYLVLSPLRFEAVSRDAAATAVYIPNIWFSVTGTDYLADVDPSPFQQYWSLGVEEQFYLIWPLLLILVWSATRKSWSAVRGVLAALLILSFAACVVFTPSFEILAFFNLPTRAWQFAVGAIVALAPALLATRVHSRPALAAALGWLGLASVLLAGVLLDASESYPGWRALVPTLGTALVIFASTPENESGPARVLNHPIAQWIGNRSYSWYLWHWPVIILPLAVRDLSVPFQLLLAALSLVLADLTYRFVENPVRDSGFLKRLPSGRFIVASLCVVVAIGSAGLVTGPLLQARALDISGPAALPIADVDGPVFTNWLPVNITPTPDRAKYDLPLASREGCGPDRYESAPVVCEYGDPDAETTYALFGDSHAAQWFPAALALAESVDARLIVLIKAGCSYSDIAPYKDGSIDQFCVDWRSNAIERLNAGDVDVVLASSLHVVRDADGAVLPAEERANAVERSLEKITPTTIVIADTPFNTESPAECVVAHRSDLTTCTVPRASVIDQEGVRLEAEAVASSGSLYLDPTPLYCTEECGPIIGDTLVYRDAHHLTATFVSARGPEFVEMAGSLLRG